VAAVFEYAPRWRLALIAGIELQLMLLRGNGTNSVNLARGIGKPGLRLRPASPHYLSDSIVHTLLEAIAQGRLQPGMTLPSEMRLARAAQVSRVTMRSALERLKTADLISSRQGGETRITLPESPGRGVDLLTKDYLHTLDDIGHVMEMLLIYTMRQRDVRGATDDGSALDNFASLSIDIQESSPDAARHLDVFSFLIAASQSPLCQYMFQLLGNPILCFFEKACDGAQRLGTLSDIDTLAQQIRVPVSANRFEPALPPPETLYGFIARGDSKRQTRSFPGPGSNTGFADRPFQAAHIRPRHRIASVAIFLPQPGLRKPASERKNARRSVGGKSQFHTRSFVVVLRTRLYLHITA